MIIHIDMDAFYASVEIRDNPKLRNLPVVVGGSPRGRGVVSAASYVAREFGIRSAMSAAQAIRLCPQAVFVRPRMSHYAAISRQVREIFDRYTSLVEPLSLDEAFLDVTGSERLFGGAPAIAALIKRQIQSDSNSEDGLPANATQQNAISEQRRSELRATSSSTTNGPRQPVGEPVRTMTTISMFPTASSGTSMEPT